MINKICKVCNKEFSIYPSELKRSKRSHCSMECRNKDTDFWPQGENHYNWKGGPVIKICQNCRKRFTVPRNQRNAKCCSRKCSGIQQGIRQQGKICHFYKGGKVKIYCGICKKAYLVYPSEVKKIKTCSKKCQSKLISRRQQGENNSCWRGNDAKYHALHYRVRKILGRPKFCEICKTHDVKKIYHWANLTGNYLDTKDYKRMCITCHKKYDKQRKEK